MQEKESRDILFFLNTNMNDTKKEIVKQHFVDIQQMVGHHERIWGECAPLKQRIWLKCAPLNNEFYSNVPPQIS